jgi:hypothetical protein
MKKTIEPKSIVILTYKDLHAAAFNRLNRAWLEEHALLEDGDRNNSSSRENRYSLREEKSSSPSWAKRSSAPVR